MVPRVGLTVEKSSLRGERGAPGFLRSVRDFLAERVVLSLSFLPAEGGKGGEGRVSGVG
jgi:hypothetical protein